MIVLCVSCDDEKAILYYIAGYIPKSLSKQACIQCSKLLSPVKVPISVPFDNKKKKKRRKKRKTKNEKKRKKKKFDDIDQNVDKSSIQAKERVHHCY